MTLREKIQNAHSNKISDYSKIYTPTAEVIEKIADDYAIEFGRWLEKLRSSEIDTIDYDLYLRYNTEELLEIFKKEL